MNTTLGDRIRLARENKNLDQKNLARKIDVAARTLQRWEKGEQVPDSNYLLRLAKCTSARPEWLLTGENEMYQSLQFQRKIIPFNKDAHLHKTNLMEIPLLSSVPAGRTALMFQPEYIERYVTVDNVRDKNAFALIVKGNSMAPKIENGDIVVVSPQLEARSGDICVVRVNDEDVLKKVKIDDKYIHLIPLNPSFDPLTVRKRDITFIGKVIKIIKNL